MEMRQRRALSIGSVISSGGKAPSIEIDAKAALQRTGTPDDSGKGAQRMAVFMREGSGVMMRQASGAMKDSASVTLLRETSSGFIPAVKIEVGRPEQCH